MIEAEITKKQQALARIQDHLRDITRHPERTKAPKQVADDQLVAALRIVSDLLPEALNAQLHEILTLRDQIHSPYLQHANQMTTLHHQTEQRSDLPSWVQRGQEEQNHDDAP